MSAKEFRNLTACFVYEPPRLLLALKKRGFGAGRWNAFGGKLHEGETIEQAAIRETQEEGGILIKQMERVGILDFEPQSTDYILKVHVFIVKEYEGEPVETEEMKPQWFEEKQIPYSEMWHDDTFWFPLFLAGKKFRGGFLFDENDRVVEHQLKEVKDFKPEDFNEIIRLINYASRENKFR